MRVLYESNPILNLDYPDPDVIRVGDIYYMVSTTMHFMPGGEILRSYDLLHWEHVTFIYNELEKTEQQMLVNGKNAYGKGMWAASIRYHKGLFYVCFVANDTGKTYLFTAKDIEGEWKRKEIEGFYHDCSLLFDDDNKIYIAYGNKDIYITQLKEDLSGPMPGGFHRMVVSDEGNPRLGYEGTHFYKINGKYYLFFIHSKREEWRRVEACFTAETLDGEFVGKDIFDDDMGYCNQGIAQGGIVDTLDGKWYGIMFQDRGAVGRIPVITPVTWENDFPVFGEGGHLPEELVFPKGKKGYIYTPLIESDNFRETDMKSSKEQKRQYGSFGFKSCWQFNHIPDISLITRDKSEGSVSFKTNTLCQNLTQAKNTLTQRLAYPSSMCEITVDASNIKEGDYAGLCVLQGCYCMVAVTKRENQYTLVVKSKETGDEIELERDAIAVKNNAVKLRIVAEFENMTDTAKMFYFSGEEWKQIGKEHKLQFGLDHFTGARIGLFCYATKESGGCVSFCDFVYKHGRE